MCYVRLRGSGARVVIGNAFLYTFDWPLFTFSSDLPDPLADMDPSLAAYTSISPIVVTLPLAAKSAQQICQAPVPIYPESR